MRTLFYLSESQMERISPFFPRSHGIPRADDRRVVSGIIWAAFTFWRLLADSFCPLAPEIRQCVPGASFFQSIKRRIFGGIAPVNVFQISFFRRNYAVNPTQRKEFYSDFMLFQYVKLDQENQARRWGASIFLRRLSQ